MDGWTIGLGLLMYCCWYLGTLLDVYEKYDMMVLMKGDNLPSLDGSMREALLSRSEVRLTPPPIDWNIIITQ